MAECGADRRTGQYPETTNWPGRLAGQFVCDPRCRLATRLLAALAALHLHQPAPLIPGEDTLDFLPLARAVGLEPRPRRVVGQRRVLTIPAVPDLADARDLVVAQI